MKQNNDSDMVTKGYFKTELKKELSILKKGLMAEIETTQDVLHQEITDLRQEVVNQISDFRKEVVHMFAAFRDEMFTKIDPLLNEIVDSREDREITTHQIKQLHQVSQNHGKRIVRLERKAA